ncbi:hypothetical protein HZS_4223, partial [Henneguya salminicola]
SGARIVLTSLESSHIKNDYTNLVELNFPSYHNYDETIGLMGKMWFYASLDVALFDPNRDYYGFYIYIYSIYWRKYNLKNKKCCTQQYPENCEIPCSYLIEVVLMELNYRF